MMKPMSQIETSQDLLPELGGILEEICSLHNEELYLDAIEKKIGPDKISDKERRKMIDELDDDQAWNQAQPFVTAYLYGDGLRVVTIAMRMNLKRGDFELDEELIITECARGNGQWFVTGKTGEGAIFRKQTFGELYKDQLAEVISSVIVGHNIDKWKAGGEKVE